MGSALTPKKLLFTQKKLALKSCGLNVLYSMHESSHWKSRDFHLSSCFRPCFNDSNGGFEKLRLSIGHVKLCSVDEIYCPTNFLSWSLGSGLKSAWWRSWWMIQGQGSWPWLELLVDEGFVCRKETETDRVGRMTKKFSLQSSMIAGHGRWSGYEKSFGEPEVI